MYRFGDGTPFPLRENFIETIVAAVDCCVALYQRDAELEAREDRQNLTRKIAAEELKRLEALKILIETAIHPLLNRKDRPRPSQAAAHKIFEAANQIIRQSRAGVVRRRDTVIHDAVPEPETDVLLPTLSEFFCRQALPRTEWRLRWSAAADGKVVADVGAQATRELELAFDVAIPPDSEWAGPMSVSALLHGMQVPSVIEVRGKRRAMNLESFAVTEVHLAPGRVALVLRESGKKASPGLHIVIPHTTEAAPLVVALDKHDQAKSPPFCLDIGGSTGIHALWAAIDARIPELIAARSALVAARLDGRETTEISHPAQLAEAILMALAPLLREMRVRSRVPGELILKRDLGGDRREELFVPRRVLSAKLAALTLRQRQVFEAIGLSDEATSDFVTRIGRRPPPMPRRAIARGSISSPTVAEEQHSGTFDTAVTDPDMLDRGTDPLDKPLRARPDTNGPAFDPDTDAGAEAETTLPKPERPTLASGVIDAIRIIRSRAQA